MKKSIWIILLASIFALFSYKGGDEETIPWSKSRRLTWSDYKGKPQKRFAAASTVYSLSRVVYDENGKVFAKIQPFFWCYDSWKKTDWINDEVLAHEQTHFDIVELYARKFRQEVAQMEYAGEKEAGAKIEDLYHKIDKELDAYQDKYDNETDGSMNGDMQRKWIKKIEGELQSTATWQDPVVKLKIRSSD